MTAARRGSRWPTTSTWPVGISDDAVVDVDRRGHRAAAGTDRAVAGATPGALARRRAHGRPWSSRRKRAGRRAASRPASHGRSSARAPRRRRDGALELVPAEVADVVGGAQRAAGGEAGADLERRPAPSAPGPSGSRSRSASRAIAAASASPAVGDGIDRRRGDELGEAAIAADARRHEGEDDGVLGDELVEREAVTAGAADGVERQRRAGHRGGRGRRDEQADERLVAVQADERAPAVDEHGEQLLVGQLVGRRARRRGRRRPGRRDPSPAPAARPRRRPTRHAARRRRAGGRGSKRRSSPRRGASTPSRARSAAASPSTATTSSLARTVRAGDVPVSRSASRRPSRSGSSHRCLLQRRQRIGERLGDRAGPEHRAGRRRQRRDRPGLQQVQCAVRVDGPLDVLRARRTPGRRPGRGGPGDAARRPADAARRRWSGPRRRGRGGRARPSSRRSRRTRARRGRPGRRRRPSGRGGRSADRRRTARRPMRRRASAARARPSRHRRDRPGGPGRRTRGPPRRRRAGRPRRTRRGPTRTRPPSTTHRRPRRSTTSARRPATIPSSDTARHAATASSIERPVHAVVSTAPGSVGSPAARASARLAAFAPTSDASVARGSESRTTVGRAAVFHVVNLTCGA